MQAAVLIFILIACLLLCLTLHELGHFAFAYLFKCNVREFSIGVGPRLLSRRNKKGLRVSLRLLPVAAYVSMDMREVRALYANEKPSQKRDEILAPLPAGKLVLEDVKPWGRVLIMLGGILVNILSFAVFSLIARYATGAPADYGVALERWFVYLGKMLSFQADEGGSLVGAANGLARLPSNVVYDYGATTLNFLVMLSLTMGILNLLPLPPLDGFKLLGLGMRAVFKKGPSPRAKDIIGYVTLALMVYVIAAVITSDVRSFTG